jgi:DNA-binding beta-propeller fold protein YncE
VTFGVRLGALAINPLTNRIYVTTNKSAVNVITGLTNGDCQRPRWNNEQHSCRCAIAPTATVLAVNTATNRIYVGGQPPNSTSPSVVVIDGSNNSVIATAGDSNNPVGVQGLAINKTTNTIYAASSAEAFVLNGASNNFINNFSFSIVHLSNTSALAVNEATNETYFVGFPSSLFVLGGFNFFNPPVLSPLLVGDGPGDVAINQATNGIYIPASQGNILTVIDGRDHSIITSLSTGISPVAVAVNPVTNRIYVCNSGDSSVTVVDGTDVAQQGQPGPPGPIGPAGSQVWNAYLAQAAKNSANVARFTPANDIC